MSSQLAMSTLMFNLGGEMMYILEQRLTAQHVGPMKSQQVLGDVARALFSPSFIVELFPKKAKMMSSPATVRSILEKVAHTSIMRLNKTSMDKLFDLIIMGVKRQLLIARNATDILQCTLIHLENMKDMVHTYPEITSTIDKCIEMYTLLFRSHNSFAIKRVRDIIARFLQDHRVKISVFLLHGLQLPNGTIIPRYDGYLPLGADVPGLVKYFAPTTLSCTCMARTHAGLACVEDGKVRGACSASFSSTASARGNGVRIRGEDVVDMAVLKVPECNQKGNTIKFNIGKGGMDLKDENTGTTGNSALVESLSHLSLRKNRFRKMLLLPHSGVCLPLPANTPILTPNRLCCLGANIYLLPVPKIEPGVEQKTEASDGDDEEARYAAEMYAKAEEDSLLASLANLPHVEHVNEATFILHDILYGEEEEGQSEKNKFRDNVVGGYVGEDFESMASRLVGNGAVEQEEEGDMDLLAMMDELAEEY